jgi:preprotein translocase subunit SecD
MSNQKLSDFKIWEIALLILAVLLLGASAAVYFSGYSVTSLLFGIDDSGGGQAIGKVSQQDGALKREREGASEFKTVYQGVPLYTKDVLVTGGGAKATISLDDGIDPRQEQTRHSESGRRKRSGPQRPQSHSGRSS